MEYRFNEHHDITDCIAVKKVISKNTAGANKWEEKAGDKKAAEIYDSGVAHIVTRKLLNQGTKSQMAESTNKQADTKNKQISSKKETRPKVSELNVKDEKKSTSVTVQSKSPNKLKQFTKWVLQSFPTKRPEAQSPMPQHSTDKEIVRLQEGHVPKHVHKGHVPKHVPKDHVPEQVQKKIESKLEQTVKKKQTLGKWHKAQDGTYNILDFGGQLIYKGIQRILMVSVAVYLVVFNLEDNLDSFASVLDSSKEWHEYHMTNLQVILYWISTIYSDSRVMEQDADSSTHLPTVLIVGTHSGSLLLGENENERKLAIKEKFDKIKRALANTPYESHVLPTYFRVENSSLNDKNIAELKMQLEKLMKKMVRTIPLSWVHFQSEIQKLSEKKVICPLEEVKSIARKCGISDENAQIALLDYLYDLGEIVFIRTIEALQNVVVVNPLGLVGYCKAVFTVIIPELQSAVMKQSWRKLDKGILEERLLRFLWKGIVEDLDRNFDFLVKLMEKFGLLCEKKSSKDCKTSQRVFYTPLRLKPIAGQQRLRQVYGIRAISIFHDFCGYLPEELFPQVVTRFIEEFQVEAAGEPELGHEYAELYLDEKHHVIFSVVTVKQRRMFKATIVRGMILNEACSLTEPEPESCKKVLKYLETAFELHNVNDRRGIHVKLCIPCPCSQNTEHMQILEDFKQNLIPCGQDRVRISRYQRLFGDGNKTEKGSVLDDRQLLRLCDAMDSNWRSLGVQLGLSHSEIHYLKCDNVQEKDAVMEMFVSWRNRQPSDVNQVSVMRVALLQRGYTQLAEQLRDDFGLPKNFSGFLHDDDLMLISNGIGINYSKVAMRLGLQWSDVQLAKTQHRDHAFDSSMELLTKWRQRQSHSTDQFQLMCKALEQEGFSSVVKQLRSNLQPTSDLCEVCLDDQTLLSICDEIKSDWKLVGVQLGLQLSEIDCIGKDNELEKNAIMAMLVSWRNKQPSNINQLSALSSALAQRGYNRLSEQLKGNLNPEEKYSEHEPSACALCSLCSDDEFSLPNLSNIPHECAVDESEFRGILLEISNHMDEEDFQVLKVTLTDHIKDAQTFSVADRATQLFECLIKQDILNPKEMGILLEVFKLTGVNHLQRFIKGCPMVTDIPITCFSKFRQSVVAFGRALTTSFAREIEYTIFGTEKLYKSKWDLIMKLEMDLKLWNNEESIESFKAKFSHHASK